MRSIRTAILPPAGLAALLAASAAVAAPELSITLDPAQSTVGFTLGATMHTVHGSAHVLQGEVSLEPASGAMDGMVIVDATTTETGNDGRDEKMHDKVLETASYPRIVLHPRRLEGDLPKSGSARVTLVADLELLGQRHAVEIPAEVRRQDDSIEVSASFEIPYVQWGLEDPSVFLLRVEKHVTVQVDAVGSVVAAATPPAAEPAAE